MTIFSMKTFKLSLACGALLALTLGCTKNRERIFTGSAFSTPYEVQILADETKHPTVELDRLIAETLRNAESTVWVGDKESELSKFNRNERLIWVPASRALVDVIEEALRVAKVTGGAWDPTSGRLLDLYRKAGKVPPGTAAIAAAKLKVGYHHLEARQDPLALKKSRHGVVVDLSALAPAYGADQVAEALRARGVGDFRIRIAASVRAQGRNARGEAWPYRYQRPIPGQSSPMHLTSEVIGLENRAVATVSIPDNQDGTDSLVHPLLIDARSGKPAGSDSVSVSVVELTALRAQGYANGFFALGATQGMELAKKLGAAAFFVAQVEDKPIAEATPFFPPTIHPTY